MDKFINELNIKIGIDGQRYIVDVLLDGESIRTFYDDEAKKVIDILTNKNVKYKTIKVEGFMSCQKGI